MLNKCLSVPFLTFLDGVVTKREMLGYLDPKHPYRASKEAQKIMDVADSNNDGVLEVDEFIKVRLDTALRKKNHSIIYIRNVITMLYLCR